MHTRWTLFLKKFTFMIKHMDGKCNHFANELSRRQNLLITLQTYIIEFQALKILYKNDTNFAKI